VQGVQAGPASAAPKPPTLRILVTNDANGYASLSKVPPG
jgi:hypothetical protein